jgi:hypothetical protein
MSGGNMSSTIPNIGCGVSDGEQNISYSSSYLLLLLHFLFLHMRGERPSAFTSFKRALAVIRKALK